MNLLSSASVFGFYTLVSRVLGYFRDILIAVFLEQVFTLMLFLLLLGCRILQRLFAEGTFNAAFMSVIQRKLKEKIRKIC